jgi:hypothetical protein
VRTDIPYNVLNGIRHKTVTNLIACDYYDIFGIINYSYLVSHRGKNRAATEVAHSILIAVYFVLSGRQFKDLGADYFTQYNREKKINSHFKQLS